MPAKTLSRRPMRRSAAANALVSPAVAKATLAIVASPSLSEPADDPLLDMWRRRQQLMPLCTGKDERVDFVSDHITVIEEKMAAIPAATVDGLRVKIKLLSEYLEFTIGNGCLDGNMLDSVLADALRMAGGAS